MKIFVAPTAVRALAVCALAAAVLACHDVPAAPSTKGIVSFSAARATDTADASRIVELTAIVDTAFLGTAGSVAFTTTAGSFAPSGVTVTVPADSTGTARAQLRAPADSAEAIVTATAGGVTRTTRITFLPAPPNRLELTATPLALKAGAANEATVTALLLRSNGTPSPGSRVTFQASPAGTTAPIGQFSADSVFATSGTVAVRFTVPDAAFRGPVTLRATATRGTRTVTDSTTIQVVSP